MSLNDMKKMILSLYLFVLPFCNMFSSVALFGYPVFTWLNMVVFALSIGIMLFEGYLERKTTLFYFFLTLSLFLSITYSVITGWSATKTVTNSIMYYIPFYIFFLIRTTKVSIQYLVKIMFFGTAIAAVISLLIGLGIMDGGLRDYTGASLNVYFIDGASGIYALLLGIYTLNSKLAFRFKTTMGILLCLFGILILLFYQSRGRMLIALALSLIMLILLSYISGAKKKIRIICLALVLVFAAWIVVINNETLKFYIDRIINRIIQTNAQEDNVSYRLFEIKNYWSLFCSNPIFGAGWGILLNDSVVNSFGLRYNAHNMFVGLIGVTGLSFAPILIFRLISMLLKGIQSIALKKNNETVFSFCMILAVISLGIANAGFGKNFCVVFMVTVYVIALSKNEISDTLNAS